MIRTSRWLGAVLLTVMASTAQTAPGDLDTTFNAGSGYTIYDQGAFETGNAVAGDTYNGTDHNLLVTRFMGG